VAVCFFRESAEIKLPAAKQPAGSSSLAADVDMSKFADEERMLQEAQREDPKHVKVESQVRGLSTHPD